MTDIIWDGCSVCNHPQREEIESVWLQKWPGRERWSIRQMEQFFNVGRSSIERHCLRHLFINLETQTRITVSQYFQNVLDGRSFIDPNRKDLLEKFELWQREQKLN
jgi:hypothetical protein